MKTPPVHTSPHRRELLKFLLASPLMGSALLETFTRETHAAETSPLLEQALEILINSPDDAINVFDFQRVAHKVIPPAHLGYLTTGVEDDATKFMNHKAYAKYYLRARRLVDVRKIDTRIQLFGESYTSPIAFSPVGSQRAFHPEGELAAARAAKTQDNLMIMSTVTSTPIEAVVEARGKPIWYQLYPTSRWDITRKLLRRAEAAGCPVVALTVDLPAPGNRETNRRLMKLDKRDCSACHQGADADALRKPMFQGTGLKSRREMSAPMLTWDFVKRLQDETSMKLFLKGIVTREDAELCVKHGVDGIIISNHGGRSEESQRGTIDSLAEISPVVGNKMPMLIDGGIRRGSDIFKALALGASAVGIGRPYLWGMGAFGEAGVSKVVELLRKELVMTMKVSGVTSIDGITASHVGHG